MTPLHVQTIQDKLFRLKQNADFIEDLVRNRSKELESDQPLYNGLEHLMQISIEIIVDVGSHILAEKFHESPSTYEQVITALGTHGIIPKDFAEQQKGMAGFRNLLVHDYDKVDPKQVIAYAHTAPESFRVFGKAFVEQIAIQSL
ncbi:MAG: DUF86 domain-containing protein [Patescibacteria group bacterium]|nr:DUF86 domain-containing protein [Patescibacteria group bacterium]MDE2172325.1 DUF86 domain-containing protein [Patescibacteria group bacterium]